GGTGHSVPPVESRPAGMLPEECHPNGGPCTQRPPAPPLDIPGLEDVQKVRVGDAHSCALTSAGVLHGWGRNPHGQIGIEGDQLVPVPVLSDVVDLSVALETTCAVLADGTARCWGMNSSGQVGNGEVSESVTEPTLVVFP